MYGVDRGSFYHEPEESKDAPKNTVDRSYILKRATAIAGVLLVGLGIGGAYELRDGRDGLGTWPSTAHKALLASAKQQDKLDNASYRASSLERKFNLTFLNPEATFGGSSGSGIRGIIGGLAASYPAVADFGTSPCLNETSYNTTVGNKAAIIPGKDGDFTVVAANKNFPDLSLSVGNGNIGQIKPTNEVTREELQAYGCPLGPDQVYK